MEDQSNTRNEENERFYLIDLEDHSNTLLQLNLNLNQLRIKVRQCEKAESDFYIRRDDSSISLFYKSTLIFSCQGLEQFENNFLCFFNSIDLKETSKPYSKFQKSTKFPGSWQNRIIQNQANNGQIKEVIEHSKILEKFESCQVLIHVKGSKTSQSYFLNSTGHYFSESLNIDSFNKFYAGVKKSKNKRFEADSIPKEVLHNIGTFVAKTVEMIEVRFIFLISRNGFLQATKNDYEQLNSFLTLALDHILCEHLKKRALSKLETIKLIFDESPINNSKIDTELLHHERVSLLGELLNTLRHELSNPLFGVILASQMMGMQELSTDSSEIVGDITQSAKRCQDIIKNFSNLYEGTDKTRDIDLFDIVKETLILTKSITKRINLSLNIPDELKNKTINLNLNPTSLSQIIFNFVTNAVDAIRAKENNSDGKIEVSIDKGDQGISISVADNGIGIRSSNINHIFEPFYTTKENGTGLGLSISQNLANQIGGNISGKSNHLGGATFALTIDKDYTFGDENSPNRG